MPCTICNDQGYKKVKNAEGFEEYTICECHKGIIDKRIIANKLVDSSIPKHFWGYELDWYKDTFKTWPLSRERDKLLNFIEIPEKFLGTNQSLWLCSDKMKTYKTSLAIQLGKGLLLHHKVKFIPFRKLMELFLDFDNKRPILHAYLSSHIIIIDDMFDLTRAAVKDYQALNLYGFIEDAINANIRFICTSNKPINAYSNDKFFSQTASLLEAESMQITLIGG